MKFIRMIISLLTWDVLPNSEQLARQQSLIEILQAVANKDKAAFELLYDRTVQSVYSLAYRITQNTLLAEEVVNDVYLQVWQQADRFDNQRGNVMAWMTVTCRSRALDALRRQHKTKQELPLDNEVLQVRDEQQPVQDLMCAIQDQQHIRQVLQQLDSEQQQLLALAYFKGYSHQELADFTNIPLGTVKSQLRRTMQTLKQLLSHQQLSTQQI